MRPPPTKRPARRSGQTRASDDAPAEERIVRAAVELFAASGYSGASTRDIARRARVNEASIYRYFATKRELFTAALEKELQPLGATSDCLRQMARTKSPREAIGLVFHLIADIVTGRPDLIRLLQFSLLEFGATMKPVYRKHLGEVIGATAKHLQRWSRQESWPRFHAEMTVLSFIATVVLAENFCRFFASSAIGRDAAKAAQACADLWCSVLVEDSDGRQWANLITPRGTHS